MRRACVMLSCCAALAACVTPRPAFQPLEWTQRLGNLQKAEFWQLDGRAAVAIGEQGWQATMDWRQQGESTEVHLAGPLGIGALVLSRTPAGLSLNGAAPNDAVLAQLQQRLGFDLPLDQLRYWLLGVPDPRSTFDLVRNDQDRARQLIQAGWSVDYDRYKPIGGDLLPEQMVLNHQGVRVRIAVDRWEPPH